MATRANFNDLKRRYREADWVSEYQRLWAIFNHWLVAEAGQTNDRACIENLKANPQIRIWIENVVSRSAYNRPYRVTDGYGGSYPRFAANSEISRFFRAAEGSPALAPRLNWPWHPGTESRVHQSHAITLTHDQFRDAYDAHHNVLASPSGITYDETLHQVLPALGVGATGCCFYRIPVPSGTTPAPSALAQMTLVQFRTVSSLVGLVSMIDSAASTTLDEDVVETLYNLRNVAMHGALDFLREEDNAAARAGYDLLDSLIRDIRDRW